MFLDQQNQYSENEYTTQSNLQIQGNPYRAINGILHRTRTNNFTISTEKQKTPKGQSNLDKENGTEGIDLTAFRIYDKATVINTPQYWHKDSNTDQWNKIRSSEINLCTYGQFIFDKAGKNVERIKDSLLNKWF